MVRNIHANLGHNLYRIGIQSVGFDARRIRLYTITFEMSAPPLSHLTAAGISRTQKQYF
jgi:hypothetical protein